MRKEGAQGDGSPPVGSRGKAPVGDLGDEVPQKLALFVTECLNFDVLEEKISKTAKNIIIKIMVGWKGGQAQGPPKYATERGSRDGATSLVKWHSPWSGGEAPDLKAF